jgi:excinuclease ABC subunit C
MIPRASVSLRLLQRIRDEAHRFAVEYHRTLRKKRTIRSELDQITGVGPARRRILLKRFRSVEKVREAGFKELSELEGINRGVAEAIYRHFHPRK